MRLLRELPEYGEWRNAMFCTHCEEKLTHRDYHDHDGICRWCGTMGRHGVLPDKIDRSRRPHFTDGRKIAIEAQKIRNSSIFVRPFLVLAELWRRRQPRPFRWEYKE